MPAPASVVWESEHRDTSDTAYGSAAKQRCMNVSADSTGQPAVTSVKGIVEAQRLAYRVLPGAVGYTQPVFV